MSNNNGKNINIILAICVIALLVMQFNSDSKADDLDFIKKQEAAKKAFEAEFIENLDKLTLTDEQKAKREFEQSLKGFTVVWSAPKSTLLELQVAVEEFNSKLISHRFCSDYTYKDSEEQRAIRKLVKAREDLPKKYAYVVQAILATEQAEADKLAFEKQKAAELAAEQKRLEAERMAREAEIAEENERLAKEKAEDDKAFARLKKIWANEKSSVETLQESLKDYVANHAGWSQIEKIVWLRLQAKRQDLNQILKNYISGILETHDW